MIVIPSIDLQGGRCVRLRRGDFDAVTDYAVAPDLLLARYRDLGAAWIHVVDLDGARNGSPGNRSILEWLASRSGVRLQVGGGLRDEAAVAACLEGGTGRAVLGSMAVLDPTAARTCLARYGPERIVLALDVRCRPGTAPAVTVRGWTSQSSLLLWDVVEAFLDSKLVHVLCTDVERDGTLAGPNLALYQEAAARYPRIAWQASGGIRDARDLHALREAGVAAAISGRALLDDRISNEELQPFLPSG
jgi:phosphoribosylformimino-5-aminoimidazole carboxamide ribotide isomerase